MNPLKKQSNNFSRNILPAAKLRTIKSRNTRSEQPIFSTNQLINKIQRPFHSKRPSKSFNLPNIVQDHTAFPTMKPFDTGIKRLIKQRNETHKNYKTNMTSLSPRNIQKYHINLEKAEYLNADLTGFPRIKKKSDQIDHQYKQKSRSSLAQKSSIMLFNQKISGTQCLKQFSEKEDLQIKMATLAYQRIQGMPSISYSSLPLDFHYIKAVNQNQPQIPQIDSSSLYQFNNIDEDQQLQFQQKLQQSARNSTAKNLKSQAGGGGEAPISQSSQNNDQNKNISKALEEEFIKKNLLLQHLYQDNYYTQLQPKEILLEESIQNGDQTKYKGALPIRDVPINQRVNQMMMNMTSNKLISDPQSQSLSHNHLAILKKNMYKNMTPKFQQSTYRANSEDNDTQYQNNNNNSSIINNKSQLNPYLVTVSKDFYKDIDEQDLFSTQLFQYDHKQLIPKTTFYATKKDKVSDYRKNLMDQLRENKDQLIVNQYKMKYRYPFHQTQFQEPQKDNMNQTSKTPLLTKDNLQQTSISTHHSKSLLLNQSPIQDDCNSGSNTKRVILLQKNVGFKAGNKLFARKSQSTQNSHKVFGFKNVFNSNSSNNQKDCSKLVVLKILTEEERSKYISITSPSNNDNKYSNSNNVQLDNKTSDNNQYDTMQVNTQKGSYNNLNLNLPNQTTISQDNEQDTSNISVLQQQPTPDKQHNHKQINRNTNETLLTKIQNNSSLQKNSTLFIKTDDDSNFQEQKSLDKQRNGSQQFKNLDNLMFFQTEVGSNIEQLQSYAKAKYSNHFFNNSNSGQLQSPLKNTKLSEIMMESSNLSSQRCGNILSFRKMINKNVLPKLVNLNNVKVNPYQQMNKTFDSYGPTTSSVILNQPLNLNPKSIFGGGGGSVIDNNSNQGTINNTQDFLRSYFDNKDPKPFDNFKRKHQMNRVRQAVAQLERQHISSSGNNKNTKTAYNNFDYSFQKKGQYSKGGRISVEVNDAVLKNQSM